MSRRTRLALTAAALLVAATPAAATTRHVAPQGIGAAPCTDPAVPCGPGTGLAAADAGDTIEFAGGEYGAGMSGVAPPVPLTLRARAGETPVVRYAGSAPAWTVTGPGNVIDGLTIINTGTGAALAAAPGAGIVVRRATLEGDRCADLASAASAAIEDGTLTGHLGGTCLQLGATGFLTRSSVRMTGLSRGTPPPAVTSSGTVEDSTVLGGILMSGPSAVVRRSTAVGGFVPAIAGNGSVTDTVAVNLLSGGDAIAADGMSSPGAAPVLRLTAVTAYAPEGTAVHARAGCLDAGPKADSRLEMVDTVARGRTDIAADIGVTCGLGQMAYHGRLSTTFSNWTVREPAATGAGAAAIQAGPGNVAGDPRFTMTAGRDPLLFDLRPLAGSPVIDAGTPAPESMPSDRDLRPRVSGAAQDIGAYEFQVAVPPPGGPGTGAPPAADTSAPRVSAALLRPVVRLGRAAVVTARLGEAATMRVAVARMAPGRRRAGRCVAPAAAAATAGRCTRLVPVRPVLTVRAGSGAVRIPLGRLRLGRGVYRVTLTAVDAAGNTSRPVRMTLRVVR
ncbi:MAG: hypothetical protein IT200_03445 [Thermoleophilia bacterium]|nr:hypothetical protein [Thermoleophilia bacterium]